MPLPELAMPEQNTRCVYEHSKDDHENSLEFLVSFSIFGAGMPEQMTWSVELAIKMEESISGDRSIDEIRKTVRPLKSNLHLHMQRKRIHKSNSTNGGQGVILPQKTEKED